MKERLVELVKSAPYGSETLGEYFNTSYIENCIVQHLLENGVIVPPCKVGDKLYFLYNNNVFDLEVEKIVQKETGLFLVDKQFNDWYSVDEIGKTLYLTREEAQAKLKEGVQG